MRRPALESLCRLVYPEQCLLCGRVLEPGSRHVCPPCSERLPWIGPHACPICGDQVGQHAATARGCAECRSQSFRFERAVAPFRYEGRIRELILQLKYGRRPSLAYALGDFLADFLAQGGLSRDVDVLVPVPLHWRRRSARGFNQSRLLAIEIGQRFGLPVVAGVLCRRRSTRSQTTYSRGQRRTNVRGAFVIAGSAADTNPFRRWLTRLRRRPSLKGQRVLLIDDVLTTGSTASECARVLREAGASRVLVATLAR
jgi:ComF family protein